MLGRRRQTTTGINLEGKYSDTRAAMGRLEVENLRTLIETLKSPGLETDLGLFPDKVFPPQEP